MTWFRHRSDIAFLGACLLVAVIVLGLQAPNTGFYGPNHGWTSSHGLAIMSHATPDNAFVGYALQQRATDGSVGYTYFDRYPPFVSVTMNGLLSLADSLPVKMRIARAAMNGVYLATLLVAGLFVYHVTERRWLSLAITLLAFSGYELVFYKDMIHYDQPALFGNFLMLLAIARYKLQRGRRWQVYIAALIAVALGRGYSTFVIVGLWALWEVGVVLFQRQTKMTLRQRLLTAVRHDAVWVTVLAVSWGAAWIGYNLVVEANQRGVPLAQTSIVDSALRRLPVLGDKDLGRTVGKDVPPWDEFAQLQFWRLLRWTVPANWDDLPRSTWPLGVAMLMGAVAYAVRLNLPYRFIVGLTALWGVVWIALMINLTHGHDYTMMYAVGIPLMLYTAVLTPLARWRGTTIVALVVAFVVFTYANFAVRTEVGDTRAEYTYDYQRINERMRGPRQAVHVNISDGECVIENDFCYVLGFYLNDHYLSDFEVADYVLGRLPTYHAEPVALPPDDTDGLLLLRDTLTPENTTAHLFDVAAGERRTIPDDATEIVTFGESLTLQHWSVTDGVTVQPCERVHFESWWLTRETLPENYSMLLAMVDANGVTVADSNTDLTILATAVWLPDHYHIDARFIDVPCDTAPGEYPLVMSVYAPGAPRSLDVVGTDGTVLGDFFFLTSLRIE